MMLQQLLRKQSETGLTAELGEQTPINVRVVEAGHEGLVAKSLTSLYEAGARGASWLRGLFLAG